MIMIAEFTLSPGGIIAWLVVGLVAGWIATRVMKGRGYVLVGDLIVGVIGALLGGLVFGLVTTGEAEFWSSIAVAILGAWILIAMVRFMGFGRREGIPKP